MVPILEVNGLSKSYPHWGGELRRLASWFGFPLEPKSRRVVLDGVSFAIGAGESVGILGRNGAGKSTLLKIITGTLHPTCGSVRKSGSVSSILELGMGFQPELSGRDNAYQISGLMGRNRAEISAVIGSIADFADIGNAFDDPVRTYSSGMQARVAFAVATAFRPQLLIVDEALAVGDAYFQAKCYERIRLFQSEGMSVLLVSHSVADIVRNCDRAILLSEGKVKLDGHPRDVSNAYLDEIFSRTPSGNSSLPTVEKEQESGADLLPDRSSITCQLEGVYELRPSYRADEYRWGNRQATITDYYICSSSIDYPSSVESGDLVRFFFKCKFDSDFHNVVPGLLIKTLDGIFVYGTNSLLLNAGWKAVPVSEGEERVFEFSFPMSLNAGDYLISLGIAAGDQLENLVPLDRRYDSIVISVTRVVAFTGMVDLGAAMVVHD